MDKNSITGFVLIFLILIGFSYWNQPSDEQLAQLRLQDSIAKVEAKRMAEAENSENAEFSTTAQSVPQSVADLFKQDSLTDRVITLENQNVKLGISTKGGRIVSVDLKNYRTADSLPLMLWTPKNSALGLEFYVQRNPINTEKLLFVPSVETSVLNAENGAQTLIMKLMIDETSYLTYKYTLQPDSYMVDFDIELVGMQRYIDMNTSYLTLNWDVKMPQLERSKEFENRYTKVMYKFSKDNVDELSSTGNEEEALTTPVQWVAFKQQFFSSVLIAKNPMQEVIVSSQENESASLLKNAGCEASLAYKGEQKEVYNMQFFFGPNSFPLLKHYPKDLDLTSLVDLGWSLFSWFNKYFVIPIFQFLGTHTSLNYGIIILILTILVKALLFPLTYKSYVSQAKMRVLKPQIDEINAKYPQDKMMERQQATMNLYKKAGVNPMGGCLPMLLQMPILIALFYFFPSAIELRQESFLWAKDLASYDSIATLPFNIPFYGNHVSLFCLLMTITNIIYMRLNSKNQPQNDQMQGMQTMMTYFMPIMMLFIFNNYSSGLSYYYFIATLITIIQTWIIQKSVDDQKILRQIEVAKTKPVKKSSFQRKLEEMQRVQQQRLKDQSKGK